MGAGTRPKGKPPLPPPSPASHLQKAMAAGGVAPSTKSKRNREPIGTGATGNDEMTEPEGGGT